jgi:hypothetical protein
MRRRTSLIALLATLSLLLTLSVSVASAESQRAFAARIQLSGANEVPPADPDATGTAIIVVVPAIDMVCWNLDWADIDGTVTAAHIHGTAPVGANAGVRVPLTVVDSAQGCTTDIDADLIAADPSQWYVNIHSTTYPGGAIRGQLH